MKRLFALVLGAAMVAALAACGGPRNPADNGQEPPAETAQALGEEEILGVYSQADNTYENALLGLGFQPGEGWEIRDEGELAQLSGLPAGASPNDALEGDGYAQVFYAQAQDGLLTVGIALEDLGPRPGDALDEQAYTELAQERVAPALEAMGVSDITTSLGAATLAGAEHPAIFLHGVLQGVELYETVVCVKAGDYIASITAASYLSDATPDILALFYAL